MKISLRRARQKGISLISALLLLLMALLAAGFTFWCGVRIVDYIRWLQAERVKEIDRLEQTTGTNQVSAQCLIRS